MMSDEFKLPVIQATRITSKLFQLTIF